jgi:hypothetical protein
MKSRIEVIKELVKKYPNDYQLGSAVRRFLTEDYWIQKGNTLRVLEYREFGEFKSLTAYGQDHKEAEREWLDQLNKI